MCSLQRTPSLEITRAPAALPVRPLPNLTVSETYGARCSFIFSLPASTFKSAPSARGNGENALEHAMQCHSRGLQAGSALSKSLVQTVGTLGNSSLCPPLQVINGCLPLHFSVCLISASKVICPQLGKYPPTPLELHCAMVKLCLLHILSENWPERTVGVELCVTQTSQDPPWVETSD